MSVISKIGLGLVAACAVFAFLVTRDPESGIPDRTLAAVGLRSIATPSSVVRESLAKGGPGSLALNAKREREATTNIAGSTG